MLHRHLRPFSTHATKGFMYVRHLLHLMMPVALGLTTATPSSSELWSEGGARGRIMPPMGSLEAAASEEEVGILFTVMRRNSGGTLMERSTEAM